MSVTVTMMSPLAAQTFNLSNGHTYTSDGAHLLLSVAAEDIYAMVSVGAMLVEYPGRNNYYSSRNPHIHDDMSAGYAVGSVWVNQVSGWLFVCESAADGAATWHPQCKVSGVDWGQLTGNLVDQADLVAALAGKSDIGHHHPMSEVDGLGDALVAVKTDIVAGAPAALDTLKEIDDAIGNDPNFAATVAAALATKVDKVAGKGLSTNDLTNALLAQIGVIQVATGTITRSTSDASGTQDVTTPFQPTLVIFSAIDTTAGGGSSGISCDGMDASGFVQCTRTEQQNVLLNLLGALAGVSLTTKDHSNSIYILSGGTGWNASISARTSTKFTLSWTKIGAGRNISVKYIAIK